MERVGRAPLRKLSRQERFIAPAQECAERGLPNRALLEGISAALRFDVPDDLESQELQQKLSDLAAADFVESVCGINPGELLFDELVNLTENRKAEILSR